MGHNTHRGARSPITQAAFSELAMNAEPNGKSAELSFAETIVTELEAVKTIAAGKPATPRELALLFLRLGTTAFGGPAAHIAMMQQEVVERRQWLTKAEFLDLLGASNLVPGPSSTELAIHIGFRKAGWVGLFLAGTCFILPAFLLVMVLAWAYVRYGQLPQIAGALYGVKPVVVAVVAQALWNLGRAAIKTRFLGGAAVGAFALAAWSANPLLTLAASGLATSGVFWFCAKRKDSIASAFRSAVRVGRYNCPAHPVEPVCGSILRAWPDFAWACVPETRLGRVWQRLCAAGVFARRSGDKTRVADNGPTAGRRCHRAGNARPRVHDGNVYRLRSGRAKRRNRGDSGNFPARVRLCRSERPACIAHPAIGNGGRVSGRRECRLSFSHGVGNRAVGAKRFTRCNHDCLSPYQPAPVAAPARQLRMAGTRRRNRWHCSRFDTPLLILNPQKEALPDRRYLCAK